MIRLPHANFTYSETMDFPYGESLPVSRIGFFIAFLRKFIFLGGKTMRYYSDPTANKALSGINREFSRLEKKAKRLRARWEAGELSDAELEKAQDQFQGIYRHVLTHVLNEKSAPEKS